MYMKLVINVYYTYSVSIEIYNELLKKTYTAILIEINFAEVFLR